MSEGKKKNHLHYRDIMQKYFTKFIASENGYPLRSMGINTLPVKRNLDTDLSSNLTSARVDCLMELEDDSLLHIEFQNSNEGDIVSRCWDYNYLISHHHRKQIGRTFEYPHIRTVVIFGGNVKPEDVNLTIDFGKNKYSIEAIFLREFPNNGKLQQILKTIEENPKKKLTAEEISAIVFGTLSFQNLDDVNERVYNIANTIGNLEDDYTKIILWSSIITMSKDYIQDSTINKIMELMKMLEHIDRYENEIRQEERQKGQEEKMIEIAKKLIGKQNDQEIMEITGITPEQLEKLKKEQ